MNKKVLNVGGNSHEISLPPYYSGWEHVLLDIDPLGKPDVVADARDLFHLPRASYDAIYCSHNLEHYLRHHASRVLTGFWHLVKPHGFIEIRVPDLVQVMEHVVNEGLDLDGVLYRLGNGQPIFVHDVLYGFGAQMEVSGVDFYAHRSGYSESSLRNFLFEHGFPWLVSSRRNLEIHVLAFKARPSKRVLSSLEINPNQLIDGTKMLDMHNLTTRAILAWDAGEFDCAVAMGEVVINCGSMNPDICLLLGEHALQKMDYPHACEFFNNVLMKDSESLQAHVGLIRALEMSGNTILVSEHLKKLGETDPELAALIPSMI